MLIAYDGINGWVDDVFYLWHFVEKLMWRWLYNLLMVVLMAGLRVYFTCSTSGETDVEVAIYLAYGGINGWVEGVFYFSH